MQVSVQGYNFAYAGAEGMRMKADVNTTSKTWHGTGSGAEVCPSLSQESMPLCHQRDSVPVDPERSVQWSRLILNDFGGGFKCPSFLFYIHLLLPSFI